MNSRASKRKSIPIETKYEIIQKQKQGVELKEIAKEYQVANSTVTNLLSKKEKIIDEYQTSIALPNRKRPKLCEVSQNANRSTQNVIDESKEITDKPKSTIVTKEEALECLRKIRLYFRYRLKKSPEIMSILDELEREIIKF